MLKFKNKHDPYNQPSSDEIIVKTATVAQHCVLKFITFIAFNRVHKTIFNLTFSVSATLSHCYSSFEIYVKFLLFSVKPHKMIYHKTYFYSLIR
jgi:hypothetical protein